MSEITTPFLMTLFLETPRVPNFLRTTGEDYRTVSIAEVPDECLREIGEAWTKRLLERAATLRSRTPASQEKE